MFTLKYVKSVFPTWLFLLPFSFLVGSTTENRVSLFYREESEDKEAKVVIIPHNFSYTSKLGECLSLAALAQAGVQEEDYKDYYCISSGPIHIEQLKSGGVVYSFPLEDSWKNYCIVDPEQDESNRMWSFDELVIEQDDLKTIAREDAVFKFSSSKHSDYANQKKVSQMSILLRQAAQSFLSSDVKPALVKVMALNHLGVAYLIGVNAFDTKDTLRDKIVTTVNPDSMLFSSDICLVWEIEYENDMPFGYFYCYKCNHSTRGLIKTSYLNCFPPDKKLADLLQEIAVEQCNDGTTDVLIRTTDNDSKPFQDILFARDKWNSLAEPLVKEHFFVPLVGRSYAQQGRYLFVVDGWGNGYLISLDGTVTQDQLPIVDKEVVIALMRDLVDKSAHLMPGLRMGCYFHIYHNPKQKADASGQYPWIESIPDNTFFSDYIEDGSPCISASELREEDITNILSQALSEDSLFEGILREAASHVPGLLASLPSDSTPVAGLLASWFSASNLFKGIGGGSSWRGRLFVDMERIATQ